VSDPTRVLNLPAGQASHRKYVVLAEASKLPLIWYPTWLDVEHVTPGIRSPGTARSDSVNGA
jgi:hypothetical protein